MSVRTVFNPNVATIDADEDIVQAAKLMRHEHVGDLIVTEHRDGHAHPIGVITDRDIVIEVVAMKIAPQDVRVGDTVKREVLALHEDEGLEHALRQMRRAGVRRAPVIDNAGRLAGVLSLDDVIDHLATLLNDIASTIRWQQTQESRERA